MPLMSYRGWRLILTLSLAMWVVTSILSYYSDRAEVTPVHCLILASAPLVGCLPAGLGSLTRQRLFRLYWALWCGITVTGTLLLFRWSAGLGGKCDHLIYGGGLLAVAAIALQGVLIRPKKRSPAPLERTGLSGTASEGTCVPGLSQAG